MSTAKFPDPLYKGFTTLANKRQTVFLTTGTLVLTILGNPQWLQANVAAAIKQVNAGTTNQTLIAAANMAGWPPCPKTMPIAHRSIAGMIIEAVTSTSNP